MQHMNGSRCRVPAALGPWPMGCRPPCRRRSPAVRRRGSRWSRRNSRRPGAWSGLIWGSPRGIRCGCWRPMGGWCAGRRVPTTGSLALVEETALPVRRRTPGRRWCSSQPGPRGCRSRCSSPAGATTSTGSPRQRLRTCAASCAGTPNRTAPAPGPAGEATLPAPDPHDPAPRPSTPPPDHPAASPARPRRQRARWHAQNSERTGWDGLTRKGP